MELSRLREPEHSS